MTHREIVISTTRKWENGFFRKSKTISWELREENFIEVMECLRALKMNFQAATVDREIMADLMAIIYLTKSVELPDGMLGGMYIDAGTDKLSADMD